MNVSTYSLVLEIKGMAGPSQRPNNPSIMQQANSLARKVIFLRMRDYGQSFTRALTVTRMSTRTKSGFLMPVPRHTSRSMSAVGRVCLAME
jgi:hypothetical protein